MDNESLYKVGDLVPSAGRYICTVCGFIIEYAEKHLAYGVKFPECPVCHAGSENGPKQVHEDFWKKID
jgi:rubrerythrin